MMLSPLIAANWKMHKTTVETGDFIARFLPLVKDVRNVEIVIAPPFTSLTAAAKSLEGSGIKLSGQDVHWEERGAFTGEISPEMLRDAGCSYVIVGHSERRHLFSENDETINRKVLASISAGLGVIFCIGETLNEREEGKTFEVLRRQIFRGLDKASPDSLVIAYEPVWAIGTGRTATPEQAQEAQSFIRNELKGLYGDSALNIRILYGGSVKPENISLLMREEDVNGALVGGASLDPESFSRIVKGGVQ
jgi:triosephosphate isomerase